jgi:hypothetical protein
VIAIAGFFICPPVGAIVALVLANSARQRIEASGGRLSGLEQASRRPRASLASAQGRSTVGKVNNQEQAFPRRNGLLGSPL